MSETLKPDDGAPNSVGRCPICRKATAVASRPFCSPRCREIDLGRWLSGSYVIAGGGTDEDGEEGRVDDGPDKDGPDKDGPDKDA